MTASDPLTDAVLHDAHVRRLPPRGWGEQRSSRQTNAEQRVVHAVHSDAESANEAGAATEDARYDARRRGGATRQNATDGVDQLRPRADAAAKNHHLRVEHGAHGGDGGGDEACGLFDRGTRGGVAAFECGEDVADGGTTTAAEADIAVGDADTADGGLEGA